MCLGSKEKEWFYRIVCSTPNEKAMVLQWCCLGLKEKALVSQRFYLGSNEKAMVLHCLCLGSPENTLVVHWFCLGYNKTKHGLTMVLLRLPQQNNTCYNGFVQGQTKNNVLTMRLFVV